MNSINFGIKMLEDKICKTRVRLNELIEINKDPEQQHCWDEMMIEQGKLDGFEIALMIIKKTTTNEKKCLE